MTIRTRMGRSAVALSLMAAATLAQADGLSDLKSALGRLQGPTPVKALVDAKTWNSQGEGKDLDETSGHASVQIEDSARGLQLLLGRDMLARMEQEERSKERDPKAKTPTLTALKEVGSDTLRPMLFAAAGLSRSIDKAVFKSETTDSYNGKPARLLNFELSVDKIPEKDRKYLKSFVGSLDVWIAEDGTPLASRMQQTIAARAYVVVSFDVKNSEETVYGLAGERLVIVKRESRNSSSGMGEKGENRVTRTLQLQS